MPKMCFSLDSLDTDCLALIAGYLSKKSISALRSSCELFSNSRYDRPNGAIRFADLDMGNRLFKLIPHIEITQENLDYLKSINGTLSPTIDKLTLVGLFNDYSYLEYFFYLTCLCIDDDKIDRFSATNFRFPRFLLILRWSHMCEIPTKCFPDRCERLLIDYYPAHLIVPKKVKILELYSNFNAGSIDIETPSSLEEIKFFYDPKNIHSINFPPSIKKLRFEERPSPFSMIKNKQVSIEKITIITSYTPSYDFKQNIREIFLGAHVIFEIA